MHSYFYYYELQPYPLLVHAVCEKPFLPNIFYRLHTKIEIYDFFATVLDARCQVGNALSGLWNFENLM